MQLQSTSPFQRTFVGSRFAQLHETYKLGQLRSALRRDLMPAMGRSLKIFCVFLLLLGQHGALVHQMWHLRDSLSPATLRSDVASQDVLSSSCAFHSAFDDVLGAVDAVHVPL